MRPEALEAIVIRVRPRPVRPPLVVGRLAPRKGAALLLVGPRVRQALEPHAVVRRRGVRGQPLEGLDAEDEGVVAAGPLAELERAAALQRLGRVAPVPVEVLGLRDPRAERLDALVCRHGGGGGGGGGKREGQAGEEGDQQG